METKFYSQYMPGPVEPTHPNWLGVRGIQPTWKGSFSPEISPTSKFYVVGAAGKSRKLDQIKADITIERLFNPEPVVPQVRLPSFREVVPMAEIQRFEDLQERHGRDAVVKYDRRGRLGGWRRRSQVGSMRGLIRDGEMALIELSRRMCLCGWGQKQVLGEDMRAYMAFRERYGGKDDFVERMT